MAKKKITKNQELWNRMVSNARRLMKRAEKRGFIFDDLKIPDRPKRVTQKALRDLKRITNPEYLYRHSMFIDHETGEVMTGEAGRKYERSQAGKRGYRKRKGIPDPTAPPPDPTAPPSGPNYPGGVSDEPYDVTAEILERMVNFLSEYGKEGYGPWLLAWWDDLIKKFGEKVVGQMLIDVGWIFDDTFLQAVVRYKDVLYSFQRKHLEYLRERDIITEEEMNEWLDERISEEDYSEFEEIYYGKK